MSDAREVITLEVYDLDGNLREEVPALFDPTAICWECEDDWQANHRAAQARGEARPDAPPPISKRPIPGAYSFTVGHPAEDARGVVIGLLPQENTLCLGHIQREDLLAIKP